MSMLLFTENFKLPQGRSHVYNFHVMLSFSAYSRVKRFPCIIYSLSQAAHASSSSSSKTLLTPCLMADTFGTVSACAVLEWAQPAAVVGLLPQLGTSVVEGQDLEEVHVKGPGVAGDLVVECHG
jgi:hypothetical protein